MWSDLTDNHNKFYVSQALQHTNGSFSLWTRYGRVGSNGVGSAQSCWSLAELNKLYYKKYREKVKKGYTEVKMANAEPAEEVKGEESKGGKSKSKLDDPLQKLISFIFDMNLIKQSIVSIGYDADKLPLGQLDKETVLEGYKYLREIEKILKSGKSGDLAALSSKFYTHIPHKFKTKKLSDYIINTKEMLQEKVDLIQNLIEIKTAHKMLNSKVKDSKSNIIDDNYAKLNCDMTTL